MAGGGKRCTTSLAYDLVAKPGILFTAGSYAEPATKAFITVGYLARRGPIGHKPVVIRITAGYLKTIGEGPDSELTFCGSKGPKTKKDDQTCPLVGDRMDLESGPHPLSSYTPCLHDLTHE